MRVIFRVDSSIEIGTGHVMRCLTLADHLRLRGHVCEFICQSTPGNMIEFITGNGYKTYTIPCTHINSNKEKNITSNVWLFDAKYSHSIMYENKYDWLILDNYSLDFKWVNYLTNNFKYVMVIDDLVQSKQYADLLLNQNLINNASQRYKNLVPETCELFLGPQYSLLRSQFYNNESRISDGSINHILVYFGANDKYNQASKSLAAIQTFPNLTAEIIIGLNHPHRQSLLSNSTSRLNVIESSHNMARSMQKADLALGVCGGAAWERCAMGLPSLVCIIADNQREDAQELHLLGAIENLGDSESVNTKNWIDAISYLQTNPSRIIEMSKNSTKVIAGYKENRFLIPQTMERLSG